MTQAGGRRLAWAAALACGLVAAREAAAFDCAKAGTVIERAICADQALKRLDDQMEAAFKALLARNQFPRETVLESQRRWIRDRREECAGSGRGAEQTLTSCLEQAYRERVAFLQDPSERRTTTTEEGRQVVKLSRELPWERQITYPVLTGADSPAFAKLDEFIRKGVREHDCDPEVAFTNNLSSETAVTVTLFPKWNLVRVSFVGTECCGGVHPFEFDDPHYFDRTTGEAVAQLAAVDRTKTAALTKRLPDDFTEECRPLFAEWVRASLVDDGDAIRFEISGGGALPRHLLACDGEGVTLPLAEAFRYLSQDSAILKLPRK